MRLVVALVAVALAGCNAVGSSSPDPSARPSLGVSNGTTLTITLVVNGQPVADFPADGPYPSIDLAALPALPWKVEARSPSGRVLTSMDVKPGDIRTITAPGGAAEHTGTMGRVDFSCGSLRIWAGDFAPSGPAPAASPGTPADCAP
jgi:hypothetical protein